MNMLSKIGQLSLVSAALLGLVHFSAQAETATVQTGTQEAVISGDNNQVIQTINQTIINHPGRGSINRFGNNKKRGRGNGSSSSERNLEERNNPSKRDKE